ncbi:MAG TPA: type II toxin-antitoxin system mRNA interferase toxin, RelE/StbE family [Treponema sp.]|nr:type II toxin-antitoxin system mRNA interferase toxin, RelE/StbE family [Treponema sp.]
MAYQVKFEEKAKADFAKLDNSVKIKILKYLKKIEERDDPRTLGEELAENLAGYWRYRVGDFRLIAEIQDDVFVVLMLVIDKRATVYKIAAKRLAK